MAFYDSRTLTATISRAQTVVLATSAVFHSNVRVITYPAFSRGTTVVLTRSGIFTSGRIIPARVVQRVASYVTTPPAVFVPTRIFSSGRALRPYALPVLTGDTGRRIVMNLNLYPTFGTRSAVLPNSSGRVSHLRILNSYRTESLARTVHDQFKEMA